MSEKKLNARVQKWRLMLSSGIHKEQKLKPRVRKGIPASIRMMAWPQLVKMEEFRRQNKEINFEKLCNQLSKSVSSISLDIPRTFPEEEDSKVLRKSMNNVLKAISLVHPRVGYCQGMNFLTLRILQVLGDEEAFWVLYILLQKDEILRNNFITPHAVEINQYVLQNLMKKHCKSLLKYFEQNQIQFRVFTMKWFLSIYSGTFKQALFNRYFEVYLLQGWSIIYAIAITILKINEPQLKKSNMEECMYILARHGDQIKNNESFMEEVYKITITSEEVHKLQKQYKEKIGEGSKKGSTIFPSENDERKFVPQEQFCTTLTFQSKAQQVNFDALYLLKS